MNTIFVPLLSSTWRKVKWFLNFFGRHTLWCKIFICKNIMVSPIGEYFWHYGCFFNPYVTKLTALAYRVYRRIYYILVLIPSSFCHENQENKNMGPCHYGSMYQFNTLFSSVIFTEGYIGTGWIMWLCKYFTGDKPGHFGPFFNSLCESHKQVEIFLPLVLQTKGSDFSFP